MSLREEDAAIWHHVQVLPSELGLVLACLNLRVAYTHQPSLIIDHFGLPLMGLALNEDLCLQLMPMSPRPNVGP